MFLKVLGSVVDTIVDNDPTVVFSVVLANLFHGEELLVTSVLLLRSWFRSWGRCIINQINKLSESSRDGHASELGHPSTSELSWLSGLLKLEYVLSTGILVHVDLQAEDLVVSHSHQVPCWVVRLAVIGFIPSTAHDFLAPNKVGNLQFVVPPSPAPVHAMLGWSLLAVQSGEFPVNSTVSADFNTGEHTTTTSVGVSRYSVGLVNVLCNRKLFIVKRRSNSRVDVQLVEDVFGLVPPLSLEGFFGGDVWRQDSVVVVMVVVLGLVINHVDFLQPFDHAATNVAWNDQTDGVSVIGHQTFTIGFPRNHNIVGRVHGPG
mmetsp:Transcript_26401/g.64327  ORF Transcript_26401/g.64327 Transcript_26401/m.64327 type:complete len:318 (-) Transcript_26401:759-1712(-)